MANPVGEFDRTESPPPSPKERKTGFNMFRSGTEEKGLAKRLLQQMRGSPPSTPRGERVQEALGLFSPREVEEEKKLSEVFPHTPPLKRVDKSKYMHDKEFYACACRRIKSLLKEEALPFTLEDQKILLAASVERLELAMEILDLKGELGLSDEVVADLRQACTALQMHKGDLDDFVKEIDGAKDNLTTYALLVEIVGGHRVFKLLRSITYKMSDLKKIYQKPYRSTEFPPREGVSIDTVPRQEVWKSIAPNGLQAYGKITINDRVCFDRDGETSLRSISQLIAALQSVLSSENKVDSAQQAEAFLAAVSTPFESILRAMSFYAFLTYHKELRRTLPGLYQSVSFPCFEQCFAPETIHVDIQLRSSEEFTVTFKLRQSLRERLKNREYKEVAILPFTWSLQKGAVQKEAPRPWEGALTLSPIEVLDTAELKDVEALALAHDERIHASATVGVKFWTQKV